MKKDMRVQIKYQCQACAGSGMVPAPPNWFESVRLYDKVTCASCGGFGEMFDWIPVLELITIIKEA